MIYTLCFNKTVTKEFGIQKPVGKELGVRGMGVTQFPMLYAPCPMLGLLAADYCTLLFCDMLKMTTRKENLATILLILLGAIIVPVLFIWSADNIFVLTTKTFIAAFFLLLLVRSVARKKGESHDRETAENNEKR